MKIIFLDRDGVINEFPGNGKYVTKVKDFHFIPRSRKAIRKFTQDGYKIFVVSNQAGVGKGLFSHDKLGRITNKMIQGVENSGGKIKKVFYSTCKSDSGCDYRKPNIGSIKKAVKFLKKDMRILKDSFFVGDTESDIQAGHNAGCRTVFVLSGREDHEYALRKWKTKPDFIAKDLYQAYEIINKCHTHSNGVLKKKKK